jgi:hypothetical protein
MRSLLTAPNRKVTLVKRRPARPTTKGETKNKKTQKQEVRGTHAKIAEHG